MAAFLELGVPDFRVHVHLSTRHRPKPKITTLASLVRLWFRSFRELHCDSIVGKQQSHCRLDKTGHDIDVDSSPFVSVL